MNGTNAQDRWKVVWNVNIPDKRFLRVLGAQRCPECIPPCEDGTILRRGSLSGVVGDSEVNNII